MHNIISHCPRAYVMQSMQSDAPVQPHTNKKIKIKNYLFHVKWNACARTLIIQCPRACQSCIRTRGNSKRKFHDNPRDIIMMIILFNTQGLFYNKACGSVQCKHVGFNMRGFIIYFLFINFVAKWEKEMSAFLNCKIRCNFSADNHFVTKNLFL